MYLIKKIIAMKNLILLLLGFTLFSCSKKAPENQIIKTLQHEELQQILTKQDNTLYVVNFWATWCVPCVKEIPDFMQVNNIYKDNPKFKMILVSLDKAADLDKKVKPFMFKNDIITDMYLLDDNKRMNEWIPAFDKNWDGAIPTTILYKNGQKLAFYGKQLNSIELENIINKHL